MREKIYITYNDTTKTLKVHDSYLMTDKRRMKSQIKQWPYQKLDRSMKSCINKWTAHNRLYNLGLKIEQSFLRNHIDLDKLDVFMDKVKDTNLTRGESLFKRVCYWILSR